MIHARDTQSVGTEMDTQKGLNRAEETCVNYWSGYSGELWPWVHLHPAVPLTWQRKAAVVEASHRDNLNTKIHDIKYQWGRLYINLYQHKLLDMYFFHSEVDLNVVTPAEHLCSNTVLFAAAMFDHWDCLKKHK